MAMRRKFRVLIATDGSPSARAAISTAVSFPWPEGTQASGVLAEQVYTVRGRHPIPVFGQAAPIAAEMTSGELATRWPEAQVTIKSDLPVDAILGEAKRVRADVIVMGWRGHSSIRRLLAGSVSRGVVRSAECSVLVVRRAAHNVEQIVIGFDGSAHAKRAVALVARLAPPRRGRVTLVTVPEVIRELPSHVLASRRIRAEVTTQGRRINRERVQDAKRALERPTRTLVKAGWKVDASVTTGAPLEDLLQAVGDAHAQLLVVGARGTGGVEHLLVGSVAYAALDRSPVPVLIAR
jgi:nucleotide-binding universal stress UspA family protein